MGLRKVGLTNMSKDGVFMFVISSSDVREKSNDEIAKEIEEAWNDDKEGKSK